MSFGFDLAHRDAIEDTHKLSVYRFNLAKNYALLSGDSAVVRRFYQLKASGMKCEDIFANTEITRSFFYNARPKNAFVYAGLIPWIVESIVRLVASSGFVLDSPLQDTDDKAKEVAQFTSGYLEQVSDDIDLQKLFERGVYTESGLGDFLYRVSVDSEISDMPLIDLIEPQNFEIEYQRGQKKKITIKERTDEISAGEQREKIDTEMRETYTKKKDKNGKTYINVFYSFWRGNRKIGDKNPLFPLCKKWWGIDELSIDLPFEDFPLVYKQNSKNSMIYRGERGVPDIHGLDTIEDSLSECLSDLVDCIRKAAPKIFVSRDLLPSNLRGETAEYNAFDHEYLITDSGIDLQHLLETQQAKIDWSAYIEPAKALISHAINKAGLSPTTLGVTGLESINSSSESQDAREKPSLRTREIKLVGWKKCLEELLNKYFQYVAYANGEDIEDYSDLINISFNEYINPSTENVVSVISQAVSGRVFSVETGVEKQFINDKRQYDLDDIIIESARIRGITPDEEMVLLGIIPQPVKDLPDDPDEKDGESANQNKESTRTLKEEEDSGKSTTTTSGDTDSK